MSEEIELKPCPFCGGKAVYHEEDETVWDFIFCSECDFIINADEVYADAKLKRKWNRRPSPWISTDTGEHPPKGKEVAIAIKYKNSDDVIYDIAIFSDWGWLTKNHPFLLNDYVKYFMYMPELPKE